MKYLIDGYNLLFTSMGSSKEFATQRQDLIHYLQMRFAALGLNGMLIFDGSHRREEESGRSYQSPLEIIYTPKGQNADSFMIEHIECAKNPKDMTLVSNDAGLRRQARSLGAHVQTNQDFVTFLHKPSHTVKGEKPQMETPKNIERLLKLFEKGEG